MCNQDTHAVRKKEKKRFCYINYYQKEITWFFIIDPNILMPKKYFSSFKSPTHCLYHSQALATRGISLHSWTACTMNLWICQEDCENRQPQPCGKWSQTTCKTSVNGKVTAAEPPAYLPIHTPQTSFLSDLGRRHWNTAAALSTALHTPWS